jgi:hypothetical protein
LGIRAAEGFWNFEFHEKIRESPLQTSRKYFL